MTDGIGCFDYPFCTREHAGGTGGVPVHPPAGSRVSGSDGPLIPDEPAAASTGDWWGEAKEAVADAIDPSDERINRYWSASRALAAVLPLFVAEATRRIEFTREKPHWASSEYWQGITLGKKHAAMIVRELAEEVGQ